MNPLCECGRAKERSADACERCLWLDGGTMGAGALIAELRALGGRATLEALTVELGITTRSVLRHLEEMLRAGRVRRTVEDGGGWCMRKGRESQWSRESPVYVLDEGLAT